MCERSESLQSLPHLGDVDDSAYEEKRGVEWGESGRAAGRGWKTHGTWIVRQVIRRAHHVQCYKEWYLVRLVSGEELDVGNWNERVYKVRDCAHDREYTVDLSDPCSYHRGHWAKTPCVYVILHLDNLKYWWKVWACVGDK